MNKTILLGRIGKDVELRYTANGQAVASLSMATTERFLKDGQKQEKTTWHNLVVWGKLAEIFSKHVSKGDQLLVEGKIENRSYDFHDGNKRYISEVIVSNFEFIGGNSAPKETTETPAQMAERVMNEPDDFDQIPF